MKKMMMFLPLIPALFSAHAYAAPALLVCHVNESVYSSGKSQAYDIETPLDGDHARFDTSGKLLDVSFGAETFTSQDIDPGKRVIFIGVTNKKDVGSSSAGEGSVIAYFDTATGDFSIQCSVR